MSKLKIDSDIRNILIAVGLVISCLIFGLYIWSNLNTMTDQSFDNGNQTHVCNLAAEVLSTENNGYGQMAKQSNIMSDAKKSWAKYNCQSFILIDDHGNTCLGSQGFRFDGLNKDESGIFTCSNIPKGSEGVK